MVGQNGPRHDHDHNSNRFPDALHRTLTMYVNYYQRELTSDDENPPIGIVLCTDKNEAVVRYALPEGNTQIFASRYKLHLPTEEELATELQRERQQIEFMERLERSVKGEND